MKKKIAFIILLSVFAILCVLCIVLEIRDLQYYVYCIKEFPNGFRVGFYYHSIFKLIVFSLCFLADIILFIFIINNKFIIWLKNTKKNYKENKRTEEKIQKLEKRLNK